MAVPSVERGFPPSGCWSTMIAIQPRSAFRRYTPSFKRIARRALARCG